jgi:hypothetical protein
MRSVSIFDSVHGRPLGEIDSNEVDEFLEVISPLWHDRVRLICALTACVSRRPAKATLGSETLLGTVLK